MKGLIQGFVLLLVLCLLLISFPKAERRENSRGAPYSTSVLLPSEDSQPHQCRFWGMIADSLPEAVVLDHLINLPNSLKHLGAFNVNGWGLAYYNDTEPTVLRGKPPASTDPNFDLATQEMAGSGARIGVGHVRLATSGATDIPDPHPFIRYKGGKWWAFGHNGGVSGAMLRNLIGPDYLAQNPPTVGNNWSDPKVVDSDLYMLYILKCTEENGWNATLGMAKAVRDISTLDSGGLNFFFTDGETLWGLRRGNTLYYCYNAASPKYSAIASQPPTASQDGWVALYDYNLVILTRNNPPQIIDDITTIPLPPRTYSLTITTTTGGTTNPPPRTYTYTANSTVQVSAIPAAGYVFDRWELDDVNAGSVNPYLVLIERDHTFRAIFSPISIGGYSTALEGYATTKPIIAYLGIVLIIAVSFSRIRRKTRRRAD